MLLPRFLALSVAVALAGCAAIPQPPPGPDSDRSFTSFSKVEYKEAYRSIARRASACFARGGLLSINHEIQADLDAAAREGRVEVFPVGLFSAEQNDADRKSYTTIIRAKDDGSEITTTGPRRDGAYIVHLLNKQWVAGDPSCSVTR